MLYSSTTFSFIGLYSATRFLSKNTSQRLNTIKSLHLSWIIPFPSHANGEQALELEENYSPHTISGPVGECLPRNWDYGHFDRRQIYHIQRQNKPEVAFATVDRPC